MFKHLDYLKGETDLEATSIDELVFTKFHLGSYTHPSHQLQVSTIVKYFMNGEKELVMKRQIR